MKRILEVLLIASACGSTFAQQPGPATPKTKLEAFSAKTGVVIIIGYSKGVIIKGDKGCAVEVQARELTDASIGRKELGILIQVSQADQTTHVSYLDYDEIPSLIAGIEYLRKLDPRSVLTLDGFQAAYHAKDELAIGILSAPTLMKPETLGGFAESGNIGKATCFMDPPRLDDLKETIVKARARLDSIKSAK